MYFYAGLIRPKGAFKVKWYLDALFKYAVFEGRSSRQAYWMFALFNFCIALVIGLVFGLLRMHFLAHIFDTIYRLCVFVPTLAIGIRRMHDTGHSGWWILMPIVNLVFACQKGDAGSNEYGDNPEACLV
jgi:uncharacterized membrane protein YhaH (DUF805 family)